MVSCSIHIDFSLYGGEHSLAGGSRPELRPQTPQVAGEQERHGRQLVYIMVDCFRRYRLYQVRLTRSRYLLMMHLSVYAEEIRKHVLHSQQLLVSVSSAADNL